MTCRIPVYGPEYELGLANKITAESNLSIAALCPLVQPEEEVRDRLNSASQSILESFAKQQFDQEDLHYLYTILVTSGWNLNDDVFSRSELWAAWDSPINKPFNLEHDPGKIIGHITSSALVDDNYSVINPNSVSDLPDKFHILTAAVIYKHLSGRDKELTQATSEMLSEIARGEWFVSMECLFSDFDYAIITPDGQNQIVARDESTAFLTQHLKAYGGRGEYGGKRVGRLMKNLSFSGKGLVRQPGNPESVIFNDVNTFRGVFAQAEDVFSTSAEVNTNNNKGENKTMADNTERLVQLEAELKQTKADYEDRLRKLDEEKVTAAFKEKDDNIASLNEKISELETAVSELSSSREEVEAKLKEAEAAHNETKTELEKAQSELNKIEAEAKKIGRASSLIDIGVEKEDAEALVAKFESLSDELFAEIVDQQKELVEAKKMWDKEKDKKDKEDKDKSSKANNEEEETDEEGESTASQADTDGVETDEETPLSSEGENADETQQALATDLSQYFAETLK